jgi:hypothetical protein
MSSIVTMSMVTHIFFCSIELLLTAGIYPNLVLDENLISSLYNWHKGLFSADEWKVICLFEHHFSKHNMNLKVAEDRQLSIDEENDQKWKFYHQYCKQPYENIHNSIKTTIENRITRKRSADLDKTYHINAFEIHLPEVIEIQMLEHINKFFPDQVRTIVTIDNATTTETNKTFIIIKLAQSELGDREMHAIINCVTSHLQQKHKLSTQCVVFIKHACLANYRNGEHILRYSLLDDLSLGKLQHDILFTWNNTEDVDIEGDVDHGTRCESCFTPDLPSPLVLSTVDVFSEWLLDVPITM